VLTQMQPPPRLGRRVKTVIALPTTNVSPSTLQSLGDAHAGTWQQRSQLDHHHRARMATATLVMLLRNHQILSVSSFMLRSSTKACANPAAATITIGSSSSDDEDEADQAPHQPSNPQSKPFRVLDQRTHVLTPDSNHHNWITERRW
jgi:hypothetical protein